MYYFFFKYAFLLLRKEEEDTQLLTYALENEQRIISREKTAHEKQIQKKRVELLTFAPTHTPVVPPSVSYAPLEKVSKKSSSAALKKELVEELKQEILHD